MRPENMLPINALYISWLRDIGYRDRPSIIKGDVKAGQIKEIKTEMDSIDLILYIMLLTRADNTTLKCRPSLRQISRDTMGLARNTILEHLEDLQGMEFIKIAKTRGRASEYFMNDFQEWRTGIKNGTGQHQTDTKIDTT